MDNNLIDKTVQLFKTKALSELSDKISDIYLFGSCARGTYDDESDIDVLVVIKDYEKNLSEYRDKILTISDNLSIDNNVVLSVIMTDKIDWDTNKNFLLLYKNIINEGKCYYGRF